MASPLSSNSENFENILKQYETISRLDKGQKLSVNKSSNDLEISFGAADTYLGWTIQSLTRSAGSFMGTGSDWSSVAQRIDQLNASAMQILDESGPGISLENIALLKQKIIAAADKLKSMGEEAYIGKKEAQEKFAHLASQIQEIAMQQNVASAQERIQGSPAAAGDEDVLPDDDDYGVLVDLEDAGGEKGLDPNIYFSSLATEIKGYDAVGEENSLMAGSLEFREDYLPGADKRDDSHVTHNAKNNLKFFCSHFCNKLDPEIAQKAIMHGAELFAHALKNPGFSLSQDPQEAGTQIAELAWFFMDAALSKNQGFIEGTFVIDDEVIHRLLLTAPEGMIGPRISSHFKGRSEQHWGIDLPASGLPIDKRTIDFALVESFSKDKKLLYFKPENWGVFLTTAYGLDMMMHGWEFFLAQLTKLQNSGGDDLPEMQKERIPATLNKRFKQLVTTLVANKHLRDSESPFSPLLSADSLEQAQKWGIAYMVKFVEALQLHIEQQPKEIQQDESFIAIKSQIDAFNAAIKEIDHLDHLEIRTGREVILTRPELLHNMEKLGIDSQNVLQEEGNVYIDLKYQATIQQIDDQYIRPLAAGEVKKTVMTQQEEKIMDVLSRLNHPLFELEGARKLISQIQGEFGKITVLNNELLMSRLDEIQQALGKIDLDREPLLKEKKKIVTDLVTLALYPPQMSNGSVLNVISYDTLIQALDELSKNPDGVVKSLDPRYFQEENTCSQKMYLLSHVNFSNAKFAEEIRSRPMHEMLYRSPALSSFLMNTRIHVPQTYRQTCIGTAHNLWFQRKCGTIGEMLMLANAGVSMIGEKLHRMPSQEKASSAYDVNVGKAPTKEEYISSILSTVAQRLISLEEEATTLVKMEASDPQAIAKLTREWNFIMQDLDTVLDPRKPKVFSYQYIPDHYYLSAAFSSVATGLGQFIPGAPKIQARWKAIQQEDLQAFAETFFGKQKKSYVYCNPNFGPGVAPMLPNISANEIWKRLMEEGGAFLDESIFSTSGASGHTMFADASFDDEEQRKVIDLYDPMHNKITKMSAEEFKEFLEAHYEKQGRTNAMYTYKHA